LPGLDKRELAVRDVKLYCEQEGGGTPLVLLHGGPGATHHGFHPWFSRARGFARIVYYDQRGCGKSQYRPGPCYSVDQAVDDLHQLRTALKIGRWVVLGHSYGGALAQCYAVKYPEDLFGLVLVGAQPAAPLPLAPGRSHEFLSLEERKKIRAIHSDRRLTMEQRLYNAFLNGDWKRQSYYKPARETIARIALYEWKHDGPFNAVMSTDLRNYDLRGAFDACPLPTLICEGTHDLTWNTDKPEKLHRLLPRARLVKFDRSAHSPFEDEPEKFFEEVKTFLQGLPRVSDEDVSRWRKDLAVWNVEQEKSPGRLLRTCGYGRKANETIAARYKTGWLDRLDDPSLLLKTGFALYDLRRYQEALAVFDKMSRIAAGNQVLLAIALIWRGHMLDLLGQRRDAIEAYKRAASLHVTAQISHDQFGLRYAPDTYASERIKEPFTRKENLER
jgi:proline-specific peptidase